MTYRTFDGTSQEETIVDGRFSSDGSQYIMDSPEKLNIGTGKDLSLYHNGTDSIIESNTNDLILNSQAGDDIFLKSGDDIFLKGEHDGVEKACADFYGNGGVSLYHSGLPKFQTISTGISVTGGATFTGDITVSNTKPTITLNDTNSESDYIVQNDDGVFAITDIDNNVGRLTIASNGQTTISGNCDFSNGIDVTGDATFTGDVSLPDDKKLQFGDTSTPDLEIHHVADSHSYVDIVDGGILYFREGGDNKFYVQPGGAQFVGSLYADNNNKIELGNNQDLQIYFDGDNSYIKEPNSVAGQLIIDGYNGVDLRQGATGDLMGRFIGGGAVKLYNDGGDPKFETFSDGVKLNGQTIITQSGTTAGGNYNLALKNTHAGNDYSLIYFQSTDSGSTTSTAASIRSKFVGTGSTNGKLEIQTRKAGTLTTALTLDETQNAIFTGGSDAKVTIYAPTHDSGSTQQVQLEFKYNQSHANDSVGYIKLVEGSTNHYGGYLSFGVPYDNSGTPATHDDVLKLNHDKTATFTGTVDLNPNATNTGGSPILKITNGSEVAGGKNYSLRPNIPGVSNTGFTIYNESDTRNELSIDGSGNATFVNDVKVLTGNIKLGTSNGISFSNYTGNNSTGTVTGNLLSDYEEGTWSPVVSSGNWSITADKGRYTKIGNVVNAWIVESALSGSGNGSEFIIEGLPFAVSEWTPGSMYAEVFNSESTVKATIAAVSDVGHNDELKVQTWGGTAVGTDFGAGYFNIHVTYRTS